MGDPFRCAHCGSWFEYIEDLDRHHISCARTPRRKDGTLAAPPNPWRFTTQLACGIIALAEVKDPNKGVSEDLDDLVRSAYEFIGQEPPFETLMRTPEDDRRELLQLLKEYEEEYGEITQEEMDALDAEMEEAEMGTIERVRRSYRYSRDVLCRSVWESIRYAIERI